MPPALTGGVDDLDEQALVRDRVVVRVRQAAPDEHTVARAGAPRARRGRAAAVAAAAFAAAAFAAAAGLTVAAAAAALVSSAAAAAGPRPFVFLLDDIREHAAPHDDGLVLTRFVCDDGACVGWESPQMGGFGRSDLNSSRPAARPPARPPAGSHARWEQQQEPAPGARRRRQLKPSTPYLFVRVQRQRAGQSVVEPRRARAHERLDGNKHALRLARALEDAEARAGAFCVLSFVCGGR